MKYRVENKYLITEGQIAILKQRLQLCMSFDSHMNGDSYYIKSLYFDDMSDSCLYENEDGVDHREKFRIRTYNNCSNYIKLEQKSKLHGYTNKLSQEISMDDCKCFMKGNSFELNSDAGFLKKKFFCQMQTRLLKPVHIVAYERTAFVESLGNVRITFDQNICGTDDISTFFDEVIPGVPVLPMRQHILEVKYDEFIPDYLKNIIDMGFLQKSSYSKYYYARKNENLR